MNCFDGCATIKKSNTDAPQSMLEPVDKITCIFDIKSDHNAYNKPSLISHKILKKKVQQSNFDPNTK